MTSPDYQTAFNTYVGQEYKIVLVNGYQVKYRLLNYNMGLILLWSVGCKTRHDDIFRLPDCVQHLTEEDFVFALGAKVTILQR